MVEQTSRRKSSEESAWQTRSFVADTTVELCAFAGNLISRKDAKTQRRRASAAVVLRAHSLRLLFLQGAPANKISHNVFLGLRTNDFRHAEFAAIRL